MTLPRTPEPPFFGPLATDWTIQDLLAWTGADDARCHDERLLPILDAVAAALGSSPTPLHGRVVTHVRLLASLVATDPRVGARTLGALAGRQERGERVLVPA